MNSDLFAMTSRSNIVRTRQHKRCIQEGDDTSEAFHQDDGNRKSSGQEVNESQLTLNEKCQVCG